MKEHRILFAEDDIELHGLIQQILKPLHWKLYFAENGVEALNIWRASQMDLVVLDVMMPFMDGLDVCRRIRRVSDVPIIFLTAKGMEQDVVKGLGCGADDYIVKPFRAMEFRARLQSRLDQVARQQATHDSKMAYQNLILDLDGRQVIHEGKVISVTPLEFQLLRYLMKNIGVVHSKEDLLHNVWGYSDSVGDLNLIEAAIGRLRKKLELDPSQPRYIQTVWGAGYRLGTND